MEEDHKSTIPMPEGDENLIAAVQHIAKELGSKKKLTYEMKRALADLGSQLSSMSMLDESTEESARESISYLEKRLGVVQEKIMSWDADQSMIWDSGQEEVYEYLKAVTEAQKMAETLETSITGYGDGNTNNARFLRTVHDVIQTAMARLEDEFRYMLVQNRQPFELEHMSFRSSEDGLDEGSMVSFEDDPSVDTIQTDAISMSRSSEEYSIDLINRDVIPDLKCIVNSMFVSKYDHECTQAYICVRKDGLDECLFILEMEKLSIEDVLKMDSDILNSKMKRWVRAMKIFVRVYLASEKRLSDQIFGEFGSASSLCFLEASKGSMFQLLNFGEAIAIGPHQPEKLYKILDMYEVLTDLVPEIDLLYTHEAGSSIKTECREVLARLGDTVRSTFFEFENVIESHVSTTPFQAGGIHPLTKYVMNYIKTLTDYDDTLNSLLRDHHKDDTSITISPETSPVSEDNTTTSFPSSPMSIHFHYIASVLESNLDDKSKLYRDPALQHFFLMNNIHYMAQKAKAMDLRTIFGDEWIRKQNRKFQQHSVFYERVAWNPLLNLLRDDGLHNHGSRSISKTLLKERFRTFYAAFDEVYKTQTAWLVADKQLRDDLQISISLKLIQAFRMFLGQHVNDVSEKHIKYSANDLENFLVDLFCGSQKSLQHLHFHRN